MNIGILLCSYDCADSLDEVMAPWFNLKGKFDFVISAVSAQFKEYSDLDIRVDNWPTLGKLSEYLQDKKINFLETPDKPLLEHEARNLALNHLLEKDVDFIWLLDGDEFYTEEQIEKIIEYINRGDNQFYTWFSIPFKNYIFDGKQWIDGFCPPRVFRTNRDFRTKLYRFHWDNDVDYEIKEEGTLYNYIQYPNKPVPKLLVDGGIKHLTWLDNEKSHQKVIYQEKHFNGICSYKWEDGHLKFNEDYYRKTRQSLPIIYKDLD
jgi:hypothetical protein